MRSAHPITERENTRLLCARGLAGAPASVRSLLIDLDGEDARIVFAAGEQPIALWRLRVPATELAALGHGGLRLLRLATHRALRDLRLPSRGFVSRIVVTSGGTALARAVLVEAVLARVGSLPLHHPSPSAARSSEPVAGPWMKRAIGAAAAAPSAGPRA